jgi:hypothetical protein
MLGFYRFKWLEPEDSDSACLQWWARRWLNFAKKQNCQLGEFAKRKCSELQIARRWLNFAKKQNCQLGEFAKKKRQRTARLPLG